MRRRPVRDAATEVETLAIEARELLAQLTTVGLEVNVGLFGTDVVSFRVKIPVAEAANPERESDDDIP